MLQRKLGNFAIEFAWPAAPPGSDRVVDTLVPTGPADVSLGGHGADG